jgi:uncharacterized protein (DUF2461 family)
MVAIEALDATFGVRTELEANPEESIDRICDTRFSADKTPLKTHIGALPAPRPRQGQRRRLTCTSSRR